MRSGCGWPVALAISGVVALFAAACGPAPPCDTSLVTLDETRIDMETYEQEAAETGARADDLKQRLEAKREEIEAIKDLPAELGRKVYELKKGSGRE